MNETEKYLVSTQKSVVDTRDKILRAITYTFSIIILPALIISVKESIEKNDILDAMVYIMAYLAWLVAGIVLIKKIKYPIRSTVILLLVFAIGGFILSQRGLSGGGILFLTTFCVMTTALIGLKFGLLAIAVSMLAMVFIGMAMVANLLPFDPATVWNSTSLLSWATACAVFLVLSLGMVWTSGILQTRLLDTLSDLRNSQDMIASQNQNLINEIERRKEVEKYLSHSQKLESIGTLAGGIAHDFNNILFPVLGHTELLLEDVPENSPLRDSLNGIYAGALRAKDLVQQILAFSRQDSNELRLMKIQPVVKEALKLIRSTIPTTIGIKQDIHPDCGLILADPTQIHQIVMNLTTNAYHAMEDNGGQLELSLKRVQLSDLKDLIPDTRPGDYVCLTVSDSGIGMDKEVIKKIFDPFFTTKKQGKGTGMGLSVVHGIVRSMNGAIQVYSEPGVGTVFHIYFPEQRGTFEKQVFKAAEPIQGGTERILLVDDEKGITVMEKQMLERLGYQVASYTSSLEAIEAFRACPETFDLVITDLSMPNMPGDKLAAELTRIRPDIPVLLCTGFSQTLSEETALYYGIRGFLLKPIVMKDLSRKIRELLDQQNT